MRNKERGAMGIGVILFAVIVYWALAHVGLAPRLF